MHLGASAALETVDLILAGDGEVASIPQDELMEGEVLHPAPKIFKETCRIDWSLPSKRIYDFVRGLSPYPGAWTTLCQDDGQPEVLKIFKTSKCAEVNFDGKAGEVFIDKNRFYVATSDGCLRVDMLQMAGKKRMDASAFVNGLRKEAVYSLE